MHHPFLFPFNLSSSSDCKTQKAALAQLVLLFPFLSSISRHNFPLEQWTFTSFWKVIPNKDKWAGCILSPQAAPRLCPEEFLWVWAQHTTTLSAITPLRSLAQPKCGQRPCEIPRPQISSLIHQDPQPSVPSNLASWFISYKQGIWLLGTSLPKLLPVNRQYQFFSVSLSKADVFVLKAQQISLTN